MNQSPRLEMRLSIEDLRYAYQEVQKAVRVHSSGMAVIHLVRFPDGRVARVVGECLEHGVEVRAILKAA